MEVAGVRIDRRIGLGTNRLVRSAGNLAFVRAAVAAGVQMIDTAHLYTGGQSEQTIGEALSPAPPSVIVATKGGFGGAGRGKPEVLHAEIDDSLRKLRTDVITLYYLHRVDPQTPLEASLSAIKEYVDRGKILHVGISNVTVEQVESARKVLPVAAVQNHYNLEERASEGVIDYCEREDIPFVPFFPLRAAGGPEVAEIARRHGVTPRQVTLAWLLRRSRVMLPIPGTLSLAHVKENLAAEDVVLSDADVAALR